MKFIQHQFGEFTNCTLCRNLLLQKTFSKITILPFPSHLHFLLQTNFVFFFFLLKGFRAYGYCLGVVLVVLKSPCPHNLHFMNPISMQWYVLILWVQKLQFEFIISLFLFDPVIKYPWYQHMSLVKKKRAKENA